MEDAPPLVFTVYDGDLNRKGVVGRPFGVSGSIRKNLPGDFTFSVDADDPRAAALGTPGARCVVEYRWDPTAPKEGLLSGAVNDVSGSGDFRSKVRTFTVTDDWDDVFNQTQGWPNPTGTILQQGAETAYFKRTGPAETVLRDITTANLTRIGSDVVFPASLGRGTSITVQIRMHLLAERLFPAVDTAGLLVRVLQVNGVRTVLVTVPTVQTRVLTEDSGVIVSGDFQRAAPTVTRVVVGAGGEGTARIFRRYVKTALETEWKMTNRPRERFVDARDVESTDPALETLLQQRADEAFAEGAPKSGLSVVLAETEQWRYGKTFKLGDRVSVRLTGAPVLSDDVREVQFAEDDSGLTVTPIVGAWAESTQDKVLAAVAALARAVRHEQRRT